MKIVTVPSHPTPQGSPVGQLASRVACGVVDVFENHTVPILSVLFFTALAAMFWHLRSLSNDFIQTTAIKNAEHFTKALAEVRTLYTQQVVVAAKQHGMTITHDHKSKAGAIPLPATFSMELAKRIGDASIGTRVRLFSDYPFPWRDDGGANDPFEHDALSRLRDNPDQPYYRFEDFNGRPSLRYSIADRMRESCIDCHNHHPDSPKTDWQVGDVRGVLEVTYPLDDVIAQTHAGLRDIFLITITSGAMGILVLTLAFRRIRKGAVALRLANTSKEKVNLMLQEHATKLEDLTMDLKHRNQELDEFTYVASHDLQEPLRKLISFGSLLRKDAGDDLSQDAQLDLKYISEAAMRMQSLVQALLALSRTGRSEITVESVPLRQCAEHALEALDEQIQETDATVSMGELPEVLGDRTLLTQLYQNLISNAIKYCKERPHIQLTSEKNGSGWVFGVQDNGIGIKHEYQEQVFAPFKRLHSRGEYEGTGIGLATCNKVVERHGGKLWVESEPGEGSYFKFTLRAKRTVAT